MRRNGPLTRTPTCLSLRGKYAPLIRKDGINQFVCIITYVDVRKGKTPKFLWAGNDGANCCWWDTSTWTFSSTCSMQT